MCGIVGMLTRAGAAPQWRSSIEHALRQMERRGPDGSGLWTDEACILGFRRLAILDLSPAGDQPMVTADGRCGLVFNGELYNYREIRERLQARGVRFRSTGDAEVVLHALAESGAAALATFNGMFALAFYDARARRLLLARDHAAIKPLYVLRDPRGVIFASQFDQLLAHPWGAGVSVDDDALSVYLNLGWLPPPLTMLPAARALEAGTWLEFDADGGERAGRWFTFPRAREPDLRGAAAVEAVSAAVAAAVRRQLVSDVPVGVLLSGGVDSPLVAAEARAGAGVAAELPAFTLGTAGDKHDESAEAARYARALGLRHLVRHVTPGEVLGLLDEVVAASGEPFDDYSMFPTLLVSRLAREYVKVVLSGDGGDDLFWGYPDRMIEPLESGGIGPVPALRWWRGGWGHGARGPGRPHTGATQLRVHRFIAPPTLTAVLPSLRMELPELPLFSFGGGSTAELAQWLRWNEVTGHLARVLQKVDRASMHASLEVRVPLLDREVVEVATRVDWRDCVDVPRRMGKRPLRAALGRHVPFQTVAKRGFTVPMASWLRGPLRPLVGDLLLSRGDLLGMPLDRDALARHAARLTSGEDDSPWLIWRLLSLVLWEERHLRPAVAHA